MNTVIQAFSRIFNNINIDSRVGLEKLTVATILVFSILFYLVFVPPVVLFSGFRSLFLYIIILVVLNLGRIFLFSSDKLYYGSPENNRYVRAFQEYWPSRHISRKFKISQKDADYYWFEKIFNPCKDPKHIRHGQRIRTIRRGYRCRLVYYLIKFFEALLLLSLVTLAVEEGLGRVWNWEAIIKSGNLWGKITFIALLALLYLAIRISNKTTLSNLTGVWRRYAEINEMHIKWIEENVPSLDYFAPSGDAHDEAHKNN